MLKVALLPLVKPFFLESVSDMFSFSRVVFPRVNPKVVHESFVSDSSDLSILTCSHAVLSEERHYFSFSIILVLYRSHCLIIFSPTECESPLNRALSVALHNITHSAAVMFCEAHLKKKKAALSSPPPCVRMCDGDFIIEMQSNLFRFAADLLNTFPDMCLAGPRPWGVRVFW